MNCGGPLAISRRATEIASCGRDKANVSRSSGAAVTSTHPWFVGTVKCQLAGMYLPVIIEGEKDAGRQQLRREQQPAGW